MKVFPARVGLYVRRYGFLHASMAWLGIRSQFVWRRIGPWVTSPYLRQWLRNCGGERIANLGGGGNRSEHWITCDVDPRADSYVDLARPLPFPDSSLDGAFLEEVIEHLSFPDAERLLDECRRCLRVGGALRISTPDLTWFHDRLSSDSSTLGSFADNEIARILGRSDSSTLARVAAINWIFLGNDHKFLYTWEALRRVLIDHGYKGIHRSSYQERESRFGRYDSHADRYGHPPEMSLYVECVK